MPKQILAVSLADQSAPSEIFLLKSENFEDSKQLVDANKTKKFDNEIIPVVVPQSMNIGKVLSLLMLVYCWLRCGKTTADVLLDPKKHWTLLRSIE